MRQQRMDKVAQFTDLYFEDEIIKSIKSAKSELRSILLALRDNTAVLSYNGQIVTARPTDFLRLVTAWNATSAVQFAIRNIITSALFSAEEKCSGSAIICAGLWVAEATIPLKKAQRCKYQELHDCLRFVGGDGLAFGAASAIVNLGGLGCRVNFTETQQSVTRIFSQVGREFYGHVDPLFGDKVGRSFDLQKCMIIAVQGVVESVASVHAILEAASQRPIVILAENFLPDVSNTMAETWRRGMGKCIPFQVSSWPEENFLTIEKWKIQCVSSERGDTFSSLKLDSNNESSISVSETACFVSTGKDDVTASLTVEVSQSLGGLTGLLKDRIKILVGFARQCARSGVTKWEDFSKLSQTLSELYSSDLVISSSSVVTGAKACQSLQKVLQEMGCVILISQGAKT